MRGWAIWRALDRARALNLRACGDPPARVGGDGVSRRRVLAGMTAGTAALSLPACFRESSASRVAVIGGGLAGLTALDRLRDNGVDALLYEARAAVGGRTRSVRGVFASDYAFDEGGQLVNSDQADMIALTRRLGLRLIDRKTLGAEHEIQVGPSGIADERGLAETLRPIAARITADSDRLDADWDAVAKEIDALSVAQYLDRHQLRAGPARDAIEAGIRTEYGAEPQDASALELLFNLPTVDGSRLTRLSLSDERYLIEGGAGQVAQRLGEKNADAIRLNKRLRQAALAADGVTLGFADGEEAHFDRVILALPASLLKEVTIEGPLPQAWRELIAEVQLGRNEKLIAGYDRASWRKAIGASGAFWSASGFSEAWDAASQAPVGEGPGALTYFLGGSQVAEAGADGRALAAQFSALVRHGDPALAEPNGKLRRTRWCDDPLTKGSYANFRPGQLTRFGGLLTLEEDGKARPSAAGPIAFAGEWLSDAWPGYMNGAVQTGRIAADAVLASVRAAAAG